MEISQISLNNTQNTKCPQFKAYSEPIIIEKENTNNKSLITALSAGLAATTALGIASFVMLKKKNKNFEALTKSLKEAQDETKKIQDELKKAKEKIEKNIDEEEEIGKVRKFFNNIKEKWTDYKEEHSWTDFRIKNPFKKKNKNNLTRREQKLVKKLESAKQIVEKLTKENQELKKGQKAQKSVKKTKKIKNAKQNVENKETKIGYLERFKQGWNNFRIKLIPSKKTKNVKQSSIVTVQTQEEFVKKSNESLESIFEKTCVDADNEIKITKQNKNSLRRKMLLNWEFLKLKFGLKKPVIEDSKKLAEEADKKIISVEPRLIKPSEKSTLTIEPDMFKVNPEEVKEEKVADVVLDVIEENSEKVIDKEVKIAKQNIENKETKIGYLERFKQGWNNFRIKLIPSKKTKNVKQSSIVTVQTQEEFVKKSNESLESIFEKACVDADNEIKVAKQNKNSLRRKMLLNWELLKLKFGLKKPVIEDGKKLAEEAKIKTKTIEPFVPKQSTSKTYTITPEMIQKQTEQTELSKLKSEGIAYAEEQCKTKEKEYEKVWQDALQEKEQLINNSEKKSGINKEIGQPKGDSEPILKNKKIAGNPAPYNDMMSKVRHTFEKLKAKKHIHNRKEYLINSRIIRGCGDRYSALHSHLLPIDELHKINSKKYDAMSKMSDAEWNNAKMSRKDFIKNKIQIIIDEIKKLRNKD